MYKVYVDGQIGQPFDTKKEAIQYAKEMNNEGFDTTVAYDLEPEVIEFIKESNKIEGIFRDPTEAEIVTFRKFLALDELTVDDLVNFVSVYQPNAKLRATADIGNVRVGNHYPMPSGLAVVYRLKEILKSANFFSTLSYQVHHDYETLHPFTDCNGRSGRAIWAWMMVREFGSIGDGLHLGFLHKWYYQSLSNGRKEDE